MENMLAKSNSNDDIKANELFYDLDTGDIIQVEKKLLNEYRKKEPVSKSMETAPGNEEKTIINDILFNNPDRYVPVLGTIGSLTSVDDPSCIHSDRLFSFTG